MWGINACIHMKLTFLSPFSNSTLYACMQHCTQSYKSIGYDADLYQPKCLLINSHVLSKHMQASFIMQTTSCKLLHKGL
jgi:hypothetical protein